MLPRAYIGAPIVSDEQLAAAWREQRTEALALELNGGGALSDRELRSGAGGGALHRASRHFMQPRRSQLQHG
jgi:hypothetical protein